MRWQTPSFWQERGITSILLWPLSLIYRLLFRFLRFSHTPAYQSSLPLICVGNVVIGGAGKTPVAVALCDMLKSKGYHPAFISRGYGGALAKNEAIKVDLQTHSAQEVGDEPLLLAQQAPVFVARERIKAVQLAEQESDINILIMDDGLQNPSIVKTVSLLVIHGGYGIGNGMLFPSGPLREPLTKAFARADAVIINGHDENHKVEALAGNLPCFQARLTPAETLPSKNKHYIAFAGIAHPSRFFTLLKESGYSLSKELAFADHYPYKADDIELLQRIAEQENAQLITTEKDWVRLPKNLQKHVLFLPVKCVFDEEDTLSTWLAPYLK